MILWAYGGLREKSDIKQIYWHIFHNACWCKKGKMFLKWNKKKIAIISSLAPSSSNEPCHESVFMHQMAPLLSEGWTHFHCFTRQKAAGVSTGLSSALLCLFCMKMRQAMKGDVSPSWAPVYYQCECAHQQTVPGNARHDGVRRRVPATASQRLFTSAGGFSEIWFPLLCLDCLHFGQPNPSGGRENELQHLLFPLIWKRSLNSQSANKFLESLLQAEQTKSH